MSKMDRRSFARSLSLSGLAYLGFRLTGCGPVGSDTRVADDGTVNAGETVTMYDLNMEAWSIYGSGQLGFTGVLKAAQIKENKVLKIKYSQDPDGHDFELTPEHFLKLRRGEAIKLLTTEAQGHKHEVRIDPIKNRVTGSDGITMPVDPNAIPPATEKLYATLDSSETSPSLYVAGSEEMKAESIEYCAAPKDKCDTDQTLWRKMKVHVEKPDRQIFVSEATLTMDPALGEAPLSMRARTKAADKLVQGIFKLLRQ